jgi:hypothetical protein
VLAIDAKTWECSRECVGPDGSRPFRFEDPPLMVVNDQAARDAWKERFGVEMPAAGRPGRKTDEPRNVRVQLLFTESEERTIDALRGEVPRSEFLRLEILRGLRRRRSAQAV